MPLYKELHQISEKLVLVSTISIPVTEISKKKNIILEKVLFIYYLLCFQKKTLEIKALIDFNCKVNTITPIYALKLGFEIRNTNVEI